MVFLRFIYMMLLIVHYMFAFSLEILYYSVVFYVFSLAMAKTIKAFILQYKLSMRSLIESLPILPSNKLSLKHL